MDQQQPLGEYIEISISCRGLKNLNTVYLSDPQVNLYEIAGGNKHNQKKLIGHTESLKHNLNPDFQTTIKTIYHFNRAQELLFEIVDTNESILGAVTELAISGDQKENFIGHVTTSMSKLMGAPNCLSKLDIERGDEKHGKLIVFIDKLKEQSQTTQIHWQWAGKKLKDVDILSKSDPFAKFYKYTVGTEKQLVHQTEVIDNDLNPVWKKWDISKETLCSQNEAFYVEVWDYNSVGGHEFIGSADIKISQILEQNVHEFKILDKKNKDAGKLVIYGAEIILPPPIKKEITFLDYLRGGWQLSMAIGIDYTFSNQPITKKDSLHRIEADKLNYYQQTIKEVCGIIINYDSDKKVPFFGFGGVPKLSNYKKPYAEYCFPLNGKKEDPACKDIDGILQAYSESLPHIEFSGPTYIAEILKSSKEFAKQNQKNDIYTVTLIMTDGQIEDMDESMKVIGECSEFPMSIIIVGIGDENFSYMKILDNIDEIRKHAKGDLKDHVRDITQFVSYKEFNFDAQQLAAKVLDIFTKQFMDYMAIHQIQPKEVQQVKLNSIDVAP